MPKHIEETKCTCNACGNVWFYGKKELQDERHKKLQNTAAEMQNLGADLSCCCSGCLPAVFLPRQQIREVRDLNKCPKCNSSAVTKEQVIHEV